MGLLPENNFGNDGARAYLALLTAKLVATITEIMADDSRLDIDEDGETMLMPSVEILALLCERYDAVPPRVSTVRQWACKYLHKFDQAGDQFGDDNCCRMARRRVIEQTFRWLEGLAESYWSC
jgi:hypothetical protein